MEESTKTDLLKRLAQLQTLSSLAVVDRELSKAHSLLKRSDVTFDKDPMGYPSIRLKKDSDGKVVQFTQPRFFDWNLYQGKTTGSCDWPSKHSLDSIEESMVTTLPDLFS